MRTGTGPALVITIPQTLLFYTRSCSRPVRGTVTTLHDESVQDVRSEKDGRLLQVSRAVTPQHPLMTRIVRVQSSLQSRLDFW